MSSKNRPIAEIIKKIDWSKIDGMFEGFGTIEEVSAYFKITPIELNRAIRKVKKQTAQEYASSMQAKACLALRQAQLRLALGHTYEKTIMVPTVKTDANGNKYMGKESQVIKVYFPPSQRMLMWLGSDYLGQGKNLNLNKQDFPVINNQNPTLEIKINGQKINQNEIEKQWTDQKEVIDITPENETE